MCKVVVIGELCEDILMHNPETVEVLGKRVWAEDITITTGGSASYAATALTHLGAKVRLCAVVGNDDAGVRMVRQLSGLGVDCGLVTVLPNHKSTASMLVCRGAEKTFLGCSPMLPMILPEIDAVCDADLIYIAGYMLFPEFWTDEAYAFFAELRRRGIPLALDGQLLPISDLDPIEAGRLQRIFPLAEVFFAAKKEAVQITGNSSPGVAGELLLQMGCNTVVLKQGANGCVVMFGEKTVKAQSYPVEAYDTVGSGDVFGASYCHGMLNGWDTQRCADFASVFTALSLGRYQTYKQYPAATEVLSLL